MDEYSVEEIREPTSLISLISLLWTVIAIWDKYDPNMYYFVILMIAGSMVSLFYLLMARKTRNYMYNSPTYIYLIFFSGITAYTESGQIFNFGNYSIPLNLLEGLTILPLLVIWLIPMNTDQFFKIQKLSKEDKLKNIWKSSILIMFLVKYLDINQKFEFLVLIPMILEPVLLGIETRDKTPMLTLQFHKELQSRFSPHISLVRTVIMIQLAFITSFLNSKIWILLLMMFIISIFFLFTGNFVSQFKEEKFDKTSDEVINDIFKDKSDNIKLLSSKSDVETSLYRVDKGMLTNKSSNHSDVKGSDLPSKAYRLGAKIRTEVKKPKYNLSNILATLRDDSFENGYVVDHSKYTFTSNKGVFKPPKDLILFPIELGQFDYRRRGEILLLGFNRPKMKAEDDQYTFKRKRIGGQSKTMTIKKKNKSQFTMGDDHIQFKDKIFNLQTIIISAEEWERMSDILPALDRQYDLSYTGFKDIDELKDIITSIGEKWNEVRDKFKLTAANFIAGLIGAEDAVFYGVDDLLGDAETKYLEDAELSKEDCEETEE